MPQILLVDAVGVTVAIDATALHGADFDGVAEAWRDARADERAVAHTTVAVRGSLPAAEMLSHLSTDVTLAALEQQRGELWMLHAAGLADESGRVVVLVAASGTGKTTAARTLAAHYRYVSDETIAMDSQGKIFAYRKPLSVIPEGGGTKQQLAPSTFEGETAEAFVMRLAKIVVLDRRDDAGDEPVVTPLSTSEAVQLLGPQTSYLSSLPKALRLIDTHLKMTGGAVKVTYREAASLEPLVAEWLQTPRNDVVPMVSYPVPAEAPTFGDDGIFRGQVADELRLDDEGLTLVLTQVEDEGGRVTVLDGIAPTLWAAADGHTRSELTDAVVAVHGAPDGADAELLVSRAVDELLTDGLLSTEPVWRIADDVAWTGEESRVVVLVLDDPACQPLALDGTAAAVWTILHEGHATPHSELLATIADAYDIDVETVLDDVVTLLTELLKKRAVTY